MPVKHISTGIGLMGGSSYADKVLSAGPLAYWPLWETSGTVARCLVNPAQNGTYNSAVNTWPPGPGIGDGHSAPFFDGANDYVNIMTATLIAAWDAGGAEWTVMLWWKVANVGVWADGAVRMAFIGYDVGTNYMDIDKLNAVNTFDDGVWAGGGVTVSNATVGTPTSWQQAVVTRSEAINSVLYYRNGTWLATDVGIGNWASAAPWNRALIGANSLVPANAWHGWLAHCALWNRPLTSGEIAGLASF